MDTWKTQARQALLDLASSHAQFTADDLLAVVGFPDDSHEPNSRNNAIGSIFREASKRGDIIAVGVTKSKVPTRKGGMVRVWRGA